MSTLGIGIIGTGWGARVQVPAFRAAGLQVTALAGSNPAKTAQIAGELSVAWHTADWRELIARSDVALVSIVTPPSLHRDMAVAALEAGKHVLCEKPTALNAAEAQAMLAAAAAHPELLALIDHELRFLPAIAHARKLIADGAIGAPRHADARFISSGRSDSTRPWTWWADASQGGGSLGAIGSHAIDLLRYLLGDEVQQAQGMFNAFVAERPDGQGGMRTVTADDFAAATLRFTHGTIATLTAGAVARIDEPSSVTFYGAEGTLRFTEGKLLHATPGAAFSDITPPHTVRFPDGISGDFPQGTVYIGHALHAALNGDRTAIGAAATFADGLAIQRAIDAIRGG